MTIDQLKHALLDYRLKEDSNVDAAVAEAIKIISGPDETLTNHDEDEETDEEEDTPDSNIS
jgi:hypothetical protein